MHLHILQHIQQDWTRASAKLREGHLDQFLFHFVWICENAEAVIALFSATIFFVDLNTIIGLSAAVDIHGPTTYSLDPMQCLRLLRQDITSGLFSA